MDALPLKLGLFEDDGLLTEVFVWLSFIEGQEPWGTW